MIQINRREFGANLFLLGGVVAVPGIFNHNEIQYFIDVFKSCKVKLLKNGRKYMKTNSLHVWRPTHEYARSTKEINSEHLIHFSEVFKG